MVALDRLADALAEIRTVRIDRDRCLPCRSPRAACSACADICPEGAITLGRSPAVATCSTCGLCAAACAADAILLDNPSDQDLLRRFARMARRGDQLSVACGRVGAGARRDGVVVGCLGRLTPELLLAAAACGFGRIQLVEPDEGCERCPCAAGRNLLQPALAAVQQVLSALGSPCRVDLQRPSAKDARADAAAAPAVGPAATPEREVRRPMEPPVHTERRAFLLSALGLLRQALPAAAAAAEPEPFTPSTSRRRAILLWALEQLAFRPLPPAITWGDAAVHLTSVCHRCAVCVRLCPNGALALDEGGLSLVPQRCHGCGLCGRVCPSGALIMGEPRPLALLTSPTALPLGSPQTVRCASCGAEEQVVAPGDDALPAPRCLPCSLRREPPEVMHA